MINKTITEEQYQAIKEAQQIIKEYNEMTGMGLGFVPNNNPLSGIMSLFQPTIPVNANGIYPTAIRIEQKLNKLFGPI
jgi:hypothetical protein